MTPEIIEMARQAGMRLDKHNGGFVDASELKRFAKLVDAKATAREREACAEICDRFQARDVGMQPAECAGAIRARGEA